jgi:hypothetical protein
VSIWESLQKFDDIILKRGQPIQLKAGRPIHLLQTKYGPNSFKTPTEYRQYVSKSINLIGHKSG